jgi:hypothetical protein
MKPIVETLMGHPDSGRELVQPVQDALAGRPRLGKKSEVRQ